MTKPRQVLYELTIQCNVFLLPFHAQTCLNLPYLAQFYQDAITKLGNLNLVT